MIRLYREDENYSPASFQGLWWYTPSSSEMWFKLRQKKEKGHLSACNKWSVTGDMQCGRIGNLVKSAEAKEERWETDAEGGCCTAQGHPVWVLLLLLFLNPSSYFPPKSLKRQFRFRKKISFYMWEKKIIHTPSDSGSLCSASPLAWGRGVATLCLQSAVRSRARWRWAGLKRCWGGEQEEEEVGATGQQPASVCPKQVGKRSFRSEVFSLVSVALKDFHLKRGSP